MAFDTSFPKAKGVFFNSDGFPENNCGHIKNFVSQNENIKLL
jgi:hypothetical protein